MSSRNDANLFEEKTKVKVEKPDVNEKNGSKKPIVAVATDFFLYLLLIFYFIFFTFPN